MVNCFVRLQRDFHTEFHEIRKNTFLNIEGTIAQLWICISLLKTQ